LVDGTGAQACRSVLDEAETRFQHAARRSCLVEHGLLLGGCRIGLRFAEPALASALMPALAHLQVNRTAPPESTLAIWADPTFVPESWRRGRIAEQGDYRLALWDGCIALAASDLGEHWLIDTQARRGYICFRTVETIQRWKQVTPLVGILNGLFQNRGAHIVHAAAVGDDRQAVLLPGASGAGKSTTALHCLADPRACFLGDDLCLVDIRSQKVTVHALYNTAKATPQEAQCLATLKFQVDPQQVRSDKLLAYLHPQIGERLARSRPLRALLLPRLGSQRLRIAPASAADAFRALARWTLIMVPCDRPASLALLGQLSRRLPAYWLDLGPDRSQIAGAIMEFLASGRRGLA
jgi:hypothetical protein